MTTHQFKIKNYDLQLHIYDDGSILSQIFLNDRLLYCQAISKVKNKFVFNKDRSLQLTPDLKLVVQKYLDLLVFS